MFNAIIMTKISVDHFLGKIVQKIRSTYLKNVIPTDAKSLVHSCKSSHNN